MKIPEHLSEKMKKNDKMFKEIEQIEKKLVNPDVSEGKKEKLRYRCPVLKEKLKGNQRGLY